MWYARPAFSLDDVGKRFTVRPEDESLNEYTKDGRLLYQGVYVTPGTSSSQTWSQPNGKRLVAWEGEWGRCEQAFALFDEKLSARKGRVKHEYVIVAVEPSLLGLTCAARA